MTATIFPLPEINHVQEQVLDSAGKLPLVQSNVYTQQNKFVFLNVQLIKMIKHATSQCNANREYNAASTWLCMLVMHIAYFVQFMLYYCINRD